ncbi:MAG: hypothetical protein AAF065_08630 [Verrucomicrobiota bacterium]
MSSSKKKDIRKLLIQSRRNRVLFTFFRGGLDTLAALIGLWLVPFAIDNLLHLPPAIRLFLGIVGLIGSVYIIWKKLLRPIRESSSLDATAVMLEQQFGIPRNLLINAYQLSNIEAEGMTATFAQQTVRTGVKKMSKLPALGKSERGVLTRTIGFAGIAATFAVCYALYGGNYLANAAQRFVNPLAGTPPIRAVEIKVAPDRDQVIVLKSNITILSSISARLEEDEPLTKIAPNIILGTDFVEPVYESQAALLMKPVARESIIDQFAARTGRQPTEQSLKEFGLSIEVDAYEGRCKLYSHKIESISGPLAFRVFHTESNAYSPSVAIGVTLPARLLSSSFQVTKPAYIGGEPISVQGPPKDLSTLPDSQVRVEIEVDNKKGSYAFSIDGKETPMVLENNLLSCDFSVDKAADYKVLLAGKGLPPYQLATGRINLLKDKAPKVRVAHQSKNLVFSIGEELLLDVIATDDHGLKVVELLYCGGREEEPGNLIFEWDAGGAPEATNQFPLIFDPERFTEGSEYVIQARCKDNRPDAEWASSEPLLIRIRELQEDLYGIDDLAMNDAFGILDEAIKTQKINLESTRNLQIYLQETLGSPSPGQKAHFTFANHTKTLNGTQEQVSNLLNRAATLFGNEHQEIADALQNQGLPASQQVLKTIYDSGKIETWLGASEVIYEGTANGVFPVKPGYRYLGIEVMEARNSREIITKGLLMNESKDVMQKTVRHWQVMAGDKSTSGTSPKTVTSVIKKLKAKPPIEVDNHVSGLQILYQHSEKKGGKGSKVAWGMCRVVLDQKRELEFNFNCKQATTVWLDNEQIDGWPFVRELSKGEHTFLVRMENPHTRLRDKSNWTLTIRDLKEGWMSLAANGQLHPYQMGQILMQRDGGMNQEFFTNGKKTSFDGGGSAFHPYVTMAFKNANHPIRHIELKSEKGQLAKVRMTGGNDLAARQNLPPLIVQLEQRQIAVLEILAKLRGQALSLVKKESKKSNKGTAEAAFVVDEEYESLPEPIREIAEEINQMNDTGDGLSRKRSAILEDGIDDLTDGQFETLTAIKAEEKQLAVKARKAVSDLSIIGNADFSDPAQIKTLESIKMDATAALERFANVAEKEITEHTDNLESKGIEQVETLKQNGITQVGSQGDATQGRKIGTENQEDEKAPIALANLPSELDDVYGEIAELADEVVDPDDPDARAQGSKLSSSDGEGGVAPGQESSMAAAGKTGAQEPDSTRELEGRSGVGRTGRANGEAVGDKAKALTQNNRAMEERDTGGKLQSGQIEDEDVEAKESATGMGKLTDVDTDFGMKGQLPQKILQDMKETNRKLDHIRENTESLKLALEMHNVNTVNIDDAIEQIEKAQRAVINKDIELLRQAHSDAVASMQFAAKQVREEVAMRESDEMLRAVEAQASGRNNRRRTPKGFEKIVGAYFETLSDQAE